MLIRERHVCQPTDLLSRYIFALSKYRAVTLEVTCRVKVNIKQPTIDKLGLRLCFIGDSYLLAELIKNNFPRAILFVAFAVAVFLNCVISAGENLADLKHLRAPAGIPVSHIVVEGGMPAIISKDTFNLAQAEMERRRTRKAPKSPKAEYLLAGRLFCGHCKGPMQGVSGTGKSGNKWYYYYCGNTRGKNKTCDKKQVSRDRLERAVVDFTVRYILQEDVLEELARKVHAAQERQNDTTSEIVFYEKKLADNKKSIANVLRAIESGAATQTLPARLQELENEQAVILGELSFLKGKHLAFTEDQILFALMKHLEPYPGESEQDYRRRIISDFVSEVYLYDGRLLIYFNISSEDGKLKSADLSNIEGGEFDEGLVSSTTSQKIRTLSSMVIRSDF